MNTSDGTRPTLHGSLLENRVETGSELAKELSQGRWRSMVRVVVTYLVTVTYLLCAVGLIVHLLQQDKVEQALAVFSSVAAASGTIIGFWFGTRGQGGTVGELMMKPLSAQTGAVQTLATPPANGAISDVSELQRLLSEYAALLPAGRLRASLDTGGVDGLLGEATLAAIDNFLSHQDPPDRFEDLAEPRLAKVKAALEKAIQARRPGQ